jgi:hypothetical protein
MQFGRYSLGRDATPSLILRQGCNYFLNPQARIEVVRQSVGGDAILSRVNKQGCNFR